jgi:hypothetical protein
MPKRLFLVHPYLPSMPPIDRAFKEGWPEADIVNLVDESLYVDVPLDGTISPALSARVFTLFHHCVASGADGILFTGTTFGSVIDAARREIAIPILRAEEAMAEQVVARGGRIMLTCTSQRAIPVVRATLDAAAARQGVSPQISEHWVAGAKGAITTGGLPAHDRLIAQEIEAMDDIDIIILGQISMMPAIPYLTPKRARRIVSSPAAAVTRMRDLVGP